MSILLLCCWKFLFTLCSIPTRIFILFNVFCVLFPWFFTLKIFIVGLNNFFFFVFIIERTKFTSINSCPIAYITKFFGLVKHISFVDWVFHEFQRYFLLYSWHSSVSRRSSLANKSFIQFSTYKYIIFFLITSSSPLQKHTKIFIDFSSFFFLLFFHFKNIYFISWKQKKSTRWWLISQFILF